MNRLTVFIIGLFVLLSGCAFYPNEAFYKNGQWIGLAAPHQVARIQQDKLAMEKLKNTSPNISSESDKIGYKGIICNTSAYNTYNFTISGPEVRGYVLDKGQCYEDTLIPGSYSTAVYKDNYMQGQPTIFRVSSRQHIFRGQKYHWYIYKE